MLLLPKIGTDTDGARVRWLKRQLGAIEAGKRILDAGAGELRFKPFCAHLKYVSQDFGQYEGGGNAGLNPATWDNSKLDHVCDIIDIPEKSASFDAILCTEVLEHVPEPMEALDELSRLAKKGATLLVTAPFTSATHFDPYHFCTGFSWNYYQHHLTKRGWRIEEVEKSGNFYQFVAQELRRLKMVMKVDGRRVPLMYYTLVVPFLWMLAGLDRKPTVSDSLLPFNIMVRATKL